MYANFRNQVLVRLTGERVLQIEEGAKRKLRTFARAHHLTDYLGSSENGCEQTGRGL